MIQKLADLAKTPIPPGVTTVITRGYAVPRKGGATYLVTDATGETRWRKRSADGRWFQLQGVNGVSPEMFGAPADGRGDDYDAFQALREFVNLGLATTVNLAVKGRYLIDRIMITGGPYQNNVEEISFENCKGLRFNTNGSCIRFKGDYAMTADYQMGDFYYSHKKHPGFIFVGCEDSRFGPDFELDGQINRSLGRDQQIKFAPGVSGTFQVGQTVRQAATGAYAKVKIVVPPNPIAPSGGLVLAPAQGVHFDMDKPNGFALAGELTSESASGVIDSFLGVAERAAHGLAIGSCQGFWVGAGRIHHFPTDGVIVGVGAAVAGVAMVSQRVELRGVKSYANGRQGLTVAGAVDSRAVNCNFDRAGLTDGPHGAHRPAAGVDIEPDLSPVSTPRTNRKTSFVFEDCTTNDCPWGAFLCSDVERTEAITVRRHQARSQRGGGILICAEHVIIQDSDFVNIMVRPVGSETDYRVEVKGCRMRVTDGVTIPLLVETNGATLEAEDNLIEFSETARLTPTALGLIRLISAGSTFRRNRILVGRDNWTKDADSGEPSYCRAFVFDCREVSGNTFDTTLRTGFWKNLYGETTQVFANTDVKGRWL